MHTFDTSEPVDLWVQIAAGQLSVVTDGFGQTTVDVAPEDPDDLEAVQLAQQTRVYSASRGRRVSVIAPRWKRADLPAIQVTVHLPAGSTVAAKTVSADIEVSGRVKDLVVKTASGRVVADEVAGRATVDSASGRTEIGTVGGSATFSTMSADASVRLVTGAVRMRSASGSLSIGRSSGTVVLTSATGNLAVAAAGSGMITTRTASGDLDVGIPTGTVARLELVCTTGEPRVDAPVDETALPSVASVRVHAVTVSGDIWVHRAAEAGEASAA